MLKEAGIKVLHKLPAVRMGVDGVIIVGSECGGHPGIRQIVTIPINLKPFVLNLKPLVLSRSKDSGISTGSTRTVFNNHP